MRTEDWETSYVRVRSLGGGSGTWSVGCLIMARRMVEELAECDLRLVFIAGNVPEAEAAERCLTEQGIDYALSLEPFTPDDPLRRGWQYMGLFFYVPLMQHRTSRLALEAGGVSPTIELDAEGAEGCHAS